MRPIYEYCLKCIHGELGQDRDMQATEARCRLKDFERLVVNPCEYAPETLDHPTQFKSRTGCRRSYDQAWSHIFGMHAKDVGIQRAEFYADEAISRITED
jgi:hypothetical protein